MTHVPARLTLLSMLSSLIVSGAIGQSIFPYHVHKEALSNGLKVLLVPMESHGLISYYTIVRTGSRDEVEPGRSGYAHFFEHMMFRGTKKYPAHEYDKIVTGIGADANASTWEDFTEYHLVFAKEDLDKVVDIESDRFRNLYYEKQAFQTEAGAIYGEYRKLITNPYAVLNERMQNLAYDVHTYKHTGIGFEEDIKAMPNGFDYSRTFFQRFYRPENAVLLIVGDIDVPSTLKRIRKSYDTWEKGYVPSLVQQEPPQRKERKQEISYAGKTLPILDVAFKGDAFDPSNKDVVAAYLLGDLAFGQNSDIYKRLVVKEQRVQSISPSFPTNRDQPLFEITAVIKKEEDVVPVQNEILAAVEQFKNVPVSAKQLDDLKSRNKYSFLMGLDTPDHVCEAVMRLIAITGDIDAIDRLYTAYDTITPPEIMNAARKYCTAERRTIIVLKGTH
jgi:zinc protease